MILITGASGFVGRHLVSALRRSLPATPVRAFDAKPVPGGWPVGVEAAYGLVDERKDVHEVVKSAEVVVHLAAKVAPECVAVTEMRRVNVEGTRNVYAAAVAAGCKLFLHMSSSGVYGNPRSPRPFREDDTPRPSTPYQVTKWEAEEAVRSMEAGDTTANIVRPAGIYGPGNQRAVLEYRRSLNRRWVVELAGGVVVHPTHVDDVVEAIIAMVTRPAPHGTILNIGGERPIRLQDLQALAANTLGLPQRRVVVPPRLAGPLAALAGPVLTLRGRPNPLLAAMIRGELFSAAVDDERFRVRYPDVPVVALHRGLREFLASASADGLLSSEQAP